MYIKSIIICFVFLFHIAEAKNFCAKKCPPGKDCCTKIFAQLKFINQINITARCGKKFCQKGETCRNRTCLKITTPRPTNVPKPTRVGQIKREVARYGSTYCHENTYYMCQYFDRMQKPPTLKGFAVTVAPADRNKQITIRKQRGGNKLEDYAIHWNFHVIFISQNQRKVKVYDLDSQLQYGVSFQIAWREALKPLPQEQENTMFRVVDYKQYLAVFSCSRPELDQNPNHPPVRQPILKNLLGEEDTCFNYRDMNNHNVSYGEVLTADKFYKRFSGK